MISQPAAAVDPAAAPATAAVTVDPAAPAAPMNVQTLRGETAVQEAEGKPLVLDPASAAANPPGGGSAAQVSPRASNQAPPQTPHWTKRQVWGVTAGIALVSVAAFIAVGLGAWASALATAWTGTPRPFHTLRIFEFSNYHTNPNLDPTARQRRPTHLPRLPRWSTPVPASSIFRTLMPCAR